MPFVNLRAADGIVFIADRKILNFSETLTKMLKIFAAEKTSEDEDLPLSSLDSNTLRRILYWAMYHKKDNPQQEDGDDSAEDWERPDEYDKYIITPWDAELFDHIDYVGLINIVEAANYLQIPSLVNIASQYLANKFNRGAENEVITYFGYAGNV